LPDGIRTRWKTAPLHGARQFSVDISSRGRFKKRRVLVVVEERYVVVLDEQKEQRTLEFISAFPANECYLEKMRRESALMETKKPQS